jgi:tetratricopeptide (TPR) repeat protein
MLWTVSLFDTFEATMAGRLEEAEALANRGLELGIQIGEPDAFTIFAGQFYTVGTFAGRHADLLPLVEQTVRDNPDMIPFQSAYAILSAAVGRTDDAQAWLDEGIANGVGRLPLDNMWTTSVIAYAVLAVELEDRAAAAELLPVITPHADEVAFNGVTSQGPIAAYVGKLASLVGEHDLAEDHLHAALATATAFGWTYHRATTLFALGQARHRRLGRLDGEATSYLTESAELCRARGFASWLPQVEALLG